MAKKDEVRKGIDNIFARTGEPEPLPSSEPQPVKSGKPGRKKKNTYQPEDVAPIGVGLTFAEGERLTRMAKELGTNRHALLLWIVREFMRKWDTGERPPTETKTVTILKQD